MREKKGGYLGSTGIDRKDRGREDGENPSRQYKSQERCLTDKHVGLCGAADAAAAVWAGLT